MSPYNNLMKMDRSLTLLFLYIDLEEKLSQKSQFLSNEKYINAQYYLYYESTHYDDSDCWVVRLSNT
jgi:hypothetical protein